MKTPNNRWESLLSWLCRGEYLDEILGDLQEYKMELLEYPAWQRPFRLWFQVLHFIRPSLAKRIHIFQKLNSTPMIQHNFTMTLRGFRRYKTSFLINLIGLAAGFGATMLIFLWVHNEWSTDKFTSHDSRLYRVMTHFQLSDRLVTWEYTSGRVAPEMRMDFPEIEHITRVNNGFFIPKGIAEAPKGNIEISGLFAENELFSVLQYPLVAGDVTTALSDKNAVVISKRLAEMVFGSVSEAVGKPFKWENPFFNTTFFVSAVFAPLPNNASSQFDAIVNYLLLIDRDDNADDWRGGYAETFVVLKPGVDKETFEAKIHDYYDDKLGNEKFTVFLQKYSDHYLYGDFEDGILKGGRIDNVRIFFFTGIFILLIAGINFINLTTAQSTVKLKEIGVKKSLGCTKRQLLLQFLQESITLSLMALIVALCMVYFSLPTFNEIAEKSLEFDLTQLWAYLVFGALGLGIVAGLYPAIYLSSFSAIDIHRRRLPKARGSWLRKTLVVVQFTISVIFITEVFVVRRQLDFMQEKPLGYNRDNVLIFSDRQSADVDVQVLMNEIRAIPGVRRVANMMGPFLWGNDSGSGYEWGEDPNNRNYLFKSPKMGYGVIETLEMEMAEGRSFDPAFNDDYTHVIVNEAAVKMMNLEEPIGYELGYGEGEEKRKIIGVVKDFQYGSMHQKREPVLIRFRERGGDFIVRMEPGMELQVIEKVEEVYRQFYPKFTFNGELLDQAYGALYRTEQRIGDLSGYFAFFAIMISCLGLFGLAIFTTARRVKEIGIRKVLGCETWRIINLLTVDFSKMVGVAILVGLPISYWVGARWLENFAYSISLDWWIFAVAGAMAFVIAWLTVGVYTVRAATANPVEALKDE